MGNEWTKLRGLAESAALDGEVGIRSAMFSAADRIAELEASLLAEELRNQSLRDDVAELEALLRALRGNAVDDPGWLDLIDAAVGDPR